MSIERTNELRAQMAVNRRRIVRIKRLQAKLSLRLHVAQTLHEQASRELWELENGQRLARNPAQITEYQAERMVAEILAFTPTIQPKRKR